VPPAFLKYPREIAVRPNAKPKRIAFRVIFLPDVRKIDVADLIFFVKIDEQRAVSDGNITHKNYRTNFVGILHEFFEKSLWE
jgi:hypothetical protein